MRDPEPENIEGRRDKMYRASAENSSASSKDIVYDVLGTEAVVCSRMQSEGHDLAGWAKRGCGMNCLSIYRCISMESRSRLMRRQQTSITLNGTLP